MKAILLACALFGAATLIGLALCAFGCGSSYTGPRPTAPDTTAAPADTCHREEANL